MKSEALDVVSYIEGAPEERRAALKKVRAIYRKVLKGSKEGIDYGMPCYKSGDDLLGAFASQKQYVALYGFGAVMAQYKAELKGGGISLGKGCVRFANVAAMDFALIETMLREKVAAKAKGC